MAEPVTLDEVWRLRENAEHLRDLERRFKETDERFRKTEEIIEEVKDAIKTLTKRMELGDSFGALGEWEGVAVGSVLKLFAESGLGVRYGSPNQTSFRDGRIMEIDILLLDTNRAIAVDVSNWADLSDVDHHLEHLGEFKTFFPEHADKALFGAIAGVAIEDSVARYAYHKGLYVVGQRGDAMAILNDDRFQPRQW